MNTLRQRIKATKQRSFAPPPKLTVSEWSDAYRQLSSEASSEPGQWITDRAPFQRGIMDALNDPAVTDVVCMKSAQVGWTEILLNVTGYFAHQDPAPILLVQPTLEMGQAFSKDRLAPMIRDTEAINRLFPKSRSKDGQNTLLHKKFHGGHLTITGANSAAGLASRPIRIALFDEVDRFPPSAGTEGDPVSLGKKRTQTFWNAKRLMGSTPTVKGHSRVENEFEKSDQRYYHVPCPHCGEKSRLKWADFDFKEAGTIDEPVWICRDCGGMATEADKYNMLKGGEWIASAEFDGTAGFHINEFYSPWSTWSGIVKAFLKAKGDPQQLKTWVNTTLGETWVESGDEIDPGTLQARAEIYNARAPLGVALITAGIDVQKDRFEVDYWGWSEDQAWFIGRQVLWCDTSKKTSYKDLDRHLKAASFKHETGDDMPVVAACMDSGYNTDLVYQYTSTTYGRRIYAVKGVDGRGKPPISVMARPKTTGRRPVRLFSLGLDAIKGRLWDKLNSDDELVHFPNNVPEANADRAFYDGLTSEVRTYKYVRGFKTEVWRQTKPRNEPWDNFGYAYAAVLILQPVWAALQQSDAEPAPVEQPTPAKQIQKARRPNRRAKPQGFVKRW